MMSDIEKTIGSMLVGDGFVMKHGEVCFTHSVVQEEYARMKKSILESMGVKFRKDHYCPAHGFGRNPVVMIRSTATALGKRLRQEFYPDGMKKIPRKMFDAFGWPEWAIIFQDDGRCNRISHYNIIRQGERVRVDCQPFAHRYEFCFPEFDDSEMMSAICSLGNLGIVARIGHHRRLGQRLLWISESASKEKFREGVLPHMCSCLAYKTELPASLRSVAHER